MIGLDTNVLARHVMQDDPRQFSRATRLVLERAALVSRALKRFDAGGADFADALIDRVATAAGCTATMTLDAGAAKAASMTLVP